jgi:condensin complex subunit 2
MSEISTSFCFICLLHLANEEGLKLETARFGDEVEEREMDPTADRVVGELQALKIWKVCNVVR